MEIVLQPGESIKVTFADSDGDIEVRFDEDAIRVQTEWADSTGREGIVYEEKFVSPEQFAPVAYEPTGHD